MATGDVRENWRNPVLWVIFFMYAGLTFLALYYHEMWGDEIHSWNIAKASGSFGELISNTKYEGHPPAWYVILWAISKFTHNLFYVQLVHFIIIALAVFLLVFFSPFPLVAKLLAPFGYYFLFEYAVLSRNYALAVLFVFGICIALQSNSRYRQFAYYFFLFLLVNTHLFALILAVCLHLYFLLAKAEKKSSNKTIAAHAGAGMLIMLTGVYFILPPSDSASGFHFWIDRLSLSQTAIDSHAALSALLPIPAWWEYHSWNTQFLLAIQRGIPVLKIISPLLSVLLIFLCVMILTGNKKSIVLFLTNFVLTSIIGLIFPLSTERYVGFIFVSFVVALWLTDQQWYLVRKRRWMIYGLLSVHVVAGLYSIVKDIRFPFSNLHRVGQLVRQAPANIVTDYSALNAVVAFTDQQIYCLDLRTKPVFLLWDRAFYKSYSDPHRYKNGVDHFFQTNSVHETYLVSTFDSATLAKTDDMLFKIYNVRLMAKIDGAIVKTDNLYLYQISTGGK